MADADDARVDLLEQKCREVEMGLAVFVESKTKRLLERKAAHTASMKEDKENSDTLEQAANTVHLNNKKASKLLGARAVQTGKVEGEIEDMTAVKAKWAGKTSTLDEKLAALKAKKAALQQELIKCDSKAGQKKDQMVEGLELYQKWLGLDFARVDDHLLKISFTNIDTYDAERVYSFTVFVTPEPESSYKVSNCEPAIPALGMLEDELNASNDFGNFVRRMRQHFKEL